MPSKEQTNKPKLRTKKKETGHVYAQVTLTGVDRQRRVRAVVDTGSTLTVVPARVAEDIGVPLFPMTLKLRLADGKEVNAEAGPVVLSCRGIQVPATVVVLPRAKPLLGAQALRSLGLAPSPTTGKLRRVRRKGVAGPAGSEKRLLTGSSGGHRLVKNRPSQGEAQWR